MAKIKISSDQVDQSARIIAPPGSPIENDVDPRNLKTLTGRTIFGGSTFAVSGASGGSLGMPTADTTTVDDTTLAEISNLFPQPGDITIKSQEIDYTTDPISVKVVISVKNSTGANVIGIKGRLQS